MESKSVFKNKVFKYIIRILACLLLFVSIYSMIEFCINGGNIFYFIVSNWLGLIFGIIIPLFYLWPDITYYIKNKNS
jgi:hypothetical protein